MQIDFVKFWFTLFAKVFVRTHCFIHEANTSSMLPNLTVVALDEKVAAVICQGLNSQSSHKVNTARHYQILSDNAFIGVGN